MKLCAQYIGAQSNGEMRVVPENGIVRNPLHSGNSDLAGSGVRCCSNIACLEGF